MNYTANRLSMILFVDGLSDNITEEPVAPANVGIMYMRIRFVTRMTNDERGTDISVCRNCIEKSGNMFSTFASSIYFEIIEAKRIDTNINANMTSRLSFCIFRNR